MSNSDQLRVDEFIKTFKEQGEKVALDALIEEDGHFDFYSALSEKAREMRDGRLFRWVLLHVPSMVKEFSFLYSPDQLQSCFDLGITIGDIDSLSHLPVLPQWFETRRNYDESGAVASEEFHDEQFARIVDIYLEHGEAYTTGHEGPRPV